MSVTAIKLKRCHRCGDEPGVDTSSDHWHVVWRVFCLGGADHDAPVEAFGHSIECAAKEWNTRPIEDALASELQQLREKLEEAEKREREANEAILVMLGQYVHNDGNNHEIDDAIEAMPGVRRAVRALAEKDAGGND